MLESIVGFILSRLFKKAPAVVATILLELFEAIVDFVEDLGDYNGMNGAEKMAYLVGKVRVFADEALDEVPRWKELPEDRRDAIIEGLAELALFIYRVTDGDELSDVKPKVIRKAARKAARQLRVPKAA